MYRKFITTIALIFFSISLLAQNFEVGILVGASDFDGDIVNSSEHYYQDFAFSSFIRYQPHHRFSLKLNYTYTELSGEDAKAIHEIRIRRNLSFRTKIHEYSINGEINILSAKRRFYPYIFGGIALFRFNPTTVYQGQTIELQPLGTEGQGIDGFADKYALTEIALPYGIGFKVRINERLSLGFEYGYRKTFTDYIDDVSGTYVNYNELLAGNGILAATLANRTNELDNSAPVMYATGVVGRGGGYSDDYHIVGVTLNYQFPKVIKKTKLFKGKKGKGVKCPTNF